MRILILDDKSKQEIERVINHAKTHRIDMDRLKKAMSGDYPPVGDYPEFVAKINEGYRVVFSYEEQPIGWCMHLSVSVGNAPKLPSPPTVELLMKEFGMGDNLNNCINVWVDEDGEYPSINVLTKAEE